MKIDDNLNMKKLLIILLAEAIVIAAVGLIVWYARNYEKL
jgi:flagellar basal body-associated protein FliL